LSVASREAKDGLFEQFARVGKALSSAKRLELLDLLSQGERHVDSLARLANLKLTTASAHLHTLKEANLVAQRRDGTKIYYRLAASDVGDLYVRLQAVASRHLADARVARDAFLGPDDTEEIDRQELLRRIEAGSVIVVDVRPAHEYVSGHIPGAVSIPLDQLASQLADLPANGDIVAYCRGAYCAMSYEAVRLLQSHGREASRLADGMLEWRLADLPVAV
jgi:rhodanese-related sulfurtransferase